ncbi:hypothetical protein [Paraburkholderia flagellata]|uniref:hypothetical protein n=1 Tax=Paraburkholderia flagellata TaxID=2883241 RepID=UPI001F45A307|nr:hypothetical protein [Paraburkholderia flagellata]
MFNDISQGNFDGPSLDIFGGAKIHSSRCSKRPGFPIAPAAGHVSDPLCFDYRVFPVCPSE